MKHPLLLPAMALAVVLAGDPRAMRAGWQGQGARQAWDWQQAAASAGPPTWFAAAFTVGGTAYVGTGYDSSNVFWAYDARTDTWARKADFPGEPRGAAFAFAVGDRGYVGAGFHEGTRFEDLWEYTPSADRWAKKASIPGRPRDHAAAFVIGRTAYVAGGMTCDGGECQDLEELWDYLPQADRWTRKADMPHAASAAACFVLNGKAYLVSGRVGDTFSTNVLEYDPRDDRWARKAAFPGSPRARAVGFSMNGKGYLATGMQSISPASAVVLRDMWEYDASRDAWSQKPDVSGPARGAAVAFVIGSRAFIGTGIDSTRTLLADFWWGQVSDHQVSRAVAPRNGAETLAPAVAARIDALVQARMTACRLLNIAVVKGGKTVFSKAYGEGRLSGEYEYGSVSKPVTSTIVLQLRHQGLIRSLDDDVGAYLPAYGDAMPAAYKGARLTLKHLLTHRGGIPHNDRPPLVDNRFNLQFEPGTRMLYSTPGYGILGQVIEAVTGMSYAEAVRRYIGEPVGAKSFGASPAFIAPGAYVSSTIEDMARFAAGIMANRYLPAGVLYKEVLRPETGTYGYGWIVENVGRDDLTALHSGSNGLPRAHVLLEPRRNAAIVVLAEMRVFAQLDLDALARAVLRTVDGRRPVPSEAPR